MSVGAGNIADVWMEVLADRIAGFELGSWRPTAHGLFFGVPEGEGALYRADRDCDDVAKIHDLAVLPEVWGVGKESAWIWSGSDLRFVKLEGGEQGLCADRFDGTAVAAWVSPDFERDVGGSIYVADNGGAVYRVDPHTMEATTVVTGVSGEIKAVGVCAGRLTVAVLTEPLEIHSWHLNGGDHELIDTTNGGGVAINSGHVYVANNGPEILRVRPVKGELLKRWFTLDCGDLGGLQASDTDLFAVSQWHERLVRVGPRTHIAPV